MPLATMPSAMDLMSSSLTLQPNLFQEFQPMGGVRARPLSRAVEGRARERNARRIRNEVSKVAVNVFMSGPPDGKISTDDTGKTKEKRKTRLESEPGASAAKAKRRPS